MKDYKYIIDTGGAQPMSVSNINYGSRETPIMGKCIKALYKLGEIEQIHDGGWPFKALLAPNPHQEPIVDILDFVWKFCVNYIPLNAVTRVIAYPIPPCQNAVKITSRNGFSSGVLVPLMGTIRFVWRHVQRRSLPLMAPK